MKFSFEKFKFKEKSGKTDSFLKYTVTPLSLSLLLRAHTRLALAYMKKIDTVVATLNLLMTLKQAQSSNNAVKFFVRAISSGREVSIEKLREIHMKTNGNDL